MKTNFLTAYGERKKVTTPTGEKFEHEYGYEINKNGQKILTITGETNVYEKIQEQLEETKIENVLQRVVAGDTTVLRPDGIYQDITEMPNNLIEARRMMQSLENTWNTLPNEIKQHYDFDLEKFIGHSGSEKWLVDMGILVPEKAETPTPATETKEETKE